jgi:hypothetical protein
VGRLFKARKMPLLYIETFEHNFESVLDSKKYPGIYIAIRVIWGIPSIYEFQEYNLSLTKWYYPKGVLENSFICSNFNWQSYSFQFKK